MSALPPGLPKPQPARDGLDTAFWEGLRDGRLVVQTCTDCGARRWPPEWVCPRCRSFEFTWQEMGGRGRVFTWTRVWHPTHPALSEGCPYIAVVVELDDDPSVRLLGNLVGSSSSSDDDARLLTVDIGLPVVAVFESDPPLLQWRPLPE